MVRQTKVKSIQEKEPELLTKEIAETKIDAEETTVEYVPSEIQERIQAKEAEDLEVARGELEVLEAEKPKTENEIIDALQRGIEGIKELSNMEITRARALLAEKAAELRREEDNSFLSQEERSTNAKNLETIKRVDELLESEQIERRGLRGEAESDNPPGGIERGIK